MAVLILIEENRRWKEKDHFLRELHKSESTTCLFHLSDGKQNFTWAASEEIRQSSKGSVAALAFLDFICFISFHFHLVFLVLSFIGFFVPLSTLVLSDADDSQVTTGTAELSHWCETTFPSRIAHLIAEFAIIKLNPRNIIFVCETSYASLVPLFTHFSPLVFLFLLLFSCSEPWPERGVGAVSSSKFVLTLSPEDHTLT